MRLNAAWYDFEARGKAWDNFWHDSAQAPAAALRDDNDSALWMRPQIEVRAAAVAVAFAVSLGLGDEIVAQPQPPALVEEAGAVVHVVPWSTAEIAARFTQRLGATDEVAVRFLAESSPGFSYVVTPPPSVFYAYSGDEVVQQPVPLADDAVPLAVPSADAAARAAAQFAVSLGTADDEIARIEVDEVEGPVIHVVPSRVVWPDPWADDELAVAPPEESAAPSFFTIEGPKVHTPPSGGGGFPPVGVVDEAAGPVLYVAPITPFVTHPWADEELAVAPPEESAAPSFFTIEGPKVHVPPAGGGGFPTAAVVDEAAGPVLWVAPTSPFVPHPWVDQELPILVPAPPEESAAPSFFTIEGPRVHIPPSGGGSEAPSAALTADDSSDPAYDAVVWAATPTVIMWGWEGEEYRPPSVPLDESTAPRLALPPAQVVRVPDPWAWAVGDDLPVAPAIVDDDPGRIFEPVAVRPLPVVFVGLDERLAASGALQPIKAKTGPAIREALMGPAVPNPLTGEALAETLTNRAIADPLTGPAIHEPLRGLTKLE